ncbi:hypothetical protein [Winogradskya humida]|uniref:Uncharacterized protein n=1 Tax=Winogradskya humida TaxID=113566 RepID=A0ABQ4A2Q0_9ACTN|nr:hypothetical protein [Actinoplanes humidus]GIE25135.1 hypothetical protein Ahu01nite_082370 [Actinoplanes humidus]
MTASDDTEILAGLLRADPAALMANIGAYWHRVEGDWRDLFWPTEETEPDRRWFSAGEPVQVMVGVGDADVCVAIPMLVGGLPSSPTYLKPAKILAVQDRYQTQDGVTLSEAIHEAERRRRASFRYCRYCRVQTDGAQLIMDSVCRGCAVRFLGVVF